MSFSPEQLHVIAVISNPLRFKSRVALYQAFERMCLQAGCHLVTVEATFGDRLPYLPHTPGVDHIKVGHTDELWLKENLVNIGVASLPPNWKYVAWVDADVEFIRKDWAVETIHQLQHYPVVQMFHNAIDQGPNGEVMQVHTSMGYSWVNSIPYHMGGKGSGMYGYGAYWHPGYAWAMTRTAFNAVGGLLDRAIIGSGDHHMAQCLIGTPDRSMPAGVSPAYRAMVRSWADRAAGLHKRVGYVEGTVAHHWHGKKADRKYWDRWSIVTKLQYDPTVDVAPDYRGVLHLTAKGERLRKPLETYFRARNEDSIDK